MNRAFWFAVILLIVVGFGFLTARCIGQTPTANIVCDGYEKTNGTLKYSCAKYDYAALAKLGVPGIPPESMNRGIQVWVRSSDPDVIGFAVTVAWGEASIETKLSLRNSDYTMLTIVPFVTDWQAIKSVNVKELKPVSSIDW